MCGRNVSLSHFDPDSLDLDVMTQEMRGLGKGKGFASAGCGSILGKNDTVEKIKDRILDLLELFTDEGIVSKDEVRNALGLLETPAVDKETDETQALREEIEERESKIYAIVSDMAEALGETIDDYEENGEEDDQVLARLEYYSARLIDEYGATREEEGESRGDKIDEIASEIADALGDNTDDYQPDGGDEDDEHIAKLRYFVGRVIDDYVAAREENENLSNA
jgi:hypothetical protein